VDNDQLTRRAFLKYAGAAATVAMASACSRAAAPAAAPTEEPTSAPTEAPTTAPTEAPTKAPEAAATEAPVSKYNEAPMLAEKVAAGELPPVEERLPKNPMIIEPLEEIGQYGGVWRRAEGNPGHIGARLGGEPYITRDRDAMTIVPNLAYKWEASEDGREFTFYLREGIRWSDGEPFTADDVMFWYEDVLLNEDLTPVVPSWLTSGGEPVVVEKIDDYTVRFKFKEPYGVFLDMMAFRSNWIIDYPKHYLKQFHPKYQDKATLDKMVKDREFEEWFQLFGREVSTRDNPDLPTLRPWVIKTKEIGTTAIAERNPYYWKVDTAGNQLPYFDKILWNITQTVEMNVMRAVSGEVDMQAMYLGFSNYTLLMENREAGDYEVRRWTSGESGTAMFINQSRAGDDELRELLQNRDFRIALSKAIDRDEINELFYLGMADSNLELYPESVKSDPEIQALFEYDIDAANAILDELGLDQRDAEGTRLLPSGRPLNLTILGHIGYPIHMDVAEVIREIWGELGIKTTTNFVAGELWGPNLQEGEFDVLAYVVDYTSGNLHYLAYARSYFPIDLSTYWATRWGWYYATKGQQGEEPIGDAKKLVEIWEKVQVTVDIEERKKLGSVLGTCGPLLSSAVPQSHVWSRTE